MSEADPFAGPRYHGRQVEVFLRNTLKLNPVVDQMLRASKKPIVVMSCGNARLGKSTLMNQFLTGIQHEHGITEYSEPFIVGDDTSHVTNGLNMAPPIKLRDLLAAHYSLDLLYEMSYLSGDEDVFVIDVEGLDSPDGTSTSNLFSQIISVMLCCTCCLYVSRGAPSGKEIENVLNLLRLCRLDISDLRSSHRSRMAMCMLPKDVIMCTTRDAFGAVRTKQLGFQKKVLDSFEKFDSSHQKLNVPALVDSRELTVECFPQMLQAENIESAAQIYWGCFRDILEVICYQISHRRLEGGSLVADTIQQTAEKIPNVRDLNSMPDISTMRLILLNAKMGELMKKSSDQMWDECKVMETPQLEQLDSRLVQDPIRTVQERFAPLDQCMAVDSLKFDWPDRWNEIASSHALELVRIVRHTLQNKNSGLPEVVKMMKEQEERMKLELERYDMLVKRMVAKIEDLQEQLDRKRKPSSWEIAGKVAESIANVASFALLFL